MNENNKASKMYFNLKFGNYCGLLLEKRLAKRVVGMLKKQQQELKELIAANIDETEIYEWTLAFPDNKQEIVRFFDNKRTHNDKINRLDLMDNVELFEVVKDVFIAPDPREAEETYLKYHDKLDFLRSES